MIDRELIAERTIWAVDKDSRGFEIRLMVGKPYKTDLEYGDWACPVALLGWHGVFPDMYGVDSWQALTVAQQLIHRLLTYFVEDGGRLFSEENGDELTVEDLFGERPEMPEALPSMTREQYQERIDALTADQLRRIDDALMAGASTQFRKVARVIGTAMAANRDSIQRIPDDFYLLRVQQLVKDGRLLSQGDLDHMRFSEIKLPE
jgi:hypothetical protein